MEPTAPQSLQAQLNTSDNQHSIKKSRSSKLFQQPGAWLTHDMDVLEDKTTQFAATHAREQEREVAVTEETQTIESMQTQKVPALNHFTHNMLASAPRIENREAIERIETNKIPTPVQYPLFSPVQLNNAGQVAQVAQVAEQQAVGQPYVPTYGIETPQAWYMPVYPPGNNFGPEYAPVYPPANNFGPGYAPVFPDVTRPTGISKERAAILIALLCIILLQALNVGPTQFLGPQGWSYVLAGPASMQSTHLLNPLAQSRAARDPKGQIAVDPQHAIDTIIGQMSMDQKIGQMMMIQFIGADYSLQLSAMISQYSVGSVLLFYANGNIVAKDQLRTLTQQIQRGSPTLPIAISIDQEGGTVDRLVQLDGPRPSEASIGATNDPTKAMQAGLQDAQDLSSYGITLNLAPVVDVDNLSTSEMHRDNRTYGTNPAIVSSMAGAYLKGLQQSGKVVGTLKHFPGLGYVNVDPHFGIPRLNRTKDAMEQIDWSPYRTLIQQGQVHAIMVTHEILPAIDATRPSSLSPQVVQGILRDEMHFQGVIMTDSLTMAGITEYYTPGQAAAIAVEAGSDMIMGANSPTELSMMIEGIKQAISDGTISTARIDASVRRILMMKYQMGLLSIPKN